MDILVILLADIILFIGIFLTFFPEKFLSHDSKKIPNFWDHHHKRDGMLINWKTRKKFTRLIGIIFIVAGLVIFWIF